jgi:hypothetical protein
MLSGIGECASERRIGESGVKIRIEQRGLKRGIAQAATRPGLSSVDLKLASSTPAAPRLTAPRRNPRSRAWPRFYRESGRQRTIRKDPAQLGSHGIVFVSRPHESLCRNCCNPLVGSVPGSRADGALGATTAQLPRPQRPQSTRPPPRQTNQDLGSGTGEKTDPGAEGRRVSTRDRGTS